MDRLEKAQIAADAAYKRKWEAGIALDEIEERCEREVSEAEAIYFERYRHWREAIAEVARLRKEAEDAQ